jgi:uncharacterized protein YbjQ (UPF0145 family)
MPAAPQAPDVIVTTTTALEGFVVVRYLGPVFGATVLKFDIFQDWFASVGDWFGGKSHRYGRRFSELIADVEAKLKEEARARGGNAVLAASFTVALTETATGEKRLLSEKEKIERKLLVSGCGTAVMVAPRERPGI